MLPSFRPMPSLERRIFQSAYQNQTNSIYSPPPFGFRQFLGRERNREDYPRYLRYLQDNPLGMPSGNDLGGIDEQESDKSSFDGGENGEDLDDDMSEDDRPYFDSDWSEAESLLNQENSTNPRTTSFMAN